MFLERIIVWSLIKSGHKRLGNYIFINGRYSHIKSVVWDIVGQVLLVLILMGWISLLIWIGKNIL